MSELLSNKTFLEMIDLVVSGFLMATMFVLAAISLGFLVVAFNYALQDYQESRSHQGNNRGEPIPAPQ